MGWADEEFRGIDLGDKRRDNRAVVLLERLAERPTASIPGACNGWAETQAATPRTNRDPATGFEVEPGGLDQDPGAVPLVSLNPASLPGSAATRRPCLWLLE